MSQTTRPASGTEPERAERLARLESVVDALAEELGVDWQPCSHCEDGVVVRTDTEMWCTDCEYARHW